MFFKQRSGLRASSYLPGNRGFVLGQAGENSGLMPVVQPVKERVGFGLMPQIAHAVKARIETGEWPPDLAKSLHHVVFDRVHAGFRNIGVGLQVKNRVERLHRTYMRL